VGAGLGLAMSDENESVCGLDEFGIPAPLLHAVGVGLKQRGVDVWGKCGLIKEWILLADAEAFYSWVQKSQITRVRVRSTGPQAKDTCRELCALLGSPNRNDGRKAKSLRRLFRWYRICGLSA
jgi:hypothetical protein